MKKILFLCIIILVGVSCDPPEHLDTHSTYWYVKNVTDESICITTVPGHLMSFLTITPGDSVCFHSFFPPQCWGIPSFDGLYDIWEKTAVQDQHTDILSSDGSLLKVWNYVDRNAEGRQLFNESFWRLYIKKSKDYTEQTYTWVFDIVPTDIAADSPDL